MTPPPSLLPLLAPPTSGWRLQSFYRAPDGSLFATLDDPSYVTPLSFGPLFMLADATNAAYKFDEANETYHVLITRLLPSADGAR